MAKFMFVYRNAVDQPQPSPEEMQQAMQVWMEWMQTGSQEGWLLDGGDALHPDGKQVAADASVTDGPFVESKELVSGYSLVQTADMDAALEIAKGCPMVTTHHGTVEVRQLAELGKE